MSADIGLKPGSRTEDFSWRIVAETDARRVETSVFSSPRRSAMWLRSGVNVGGVDRKEARREFAIPLATEEERTAYESGLNGILSLYEGKFVPSVTEEGTRVVVGSYRHSRRGAPALSLDTVDGGQAVRHFWVKPT